MILVIQSPQPLGVSPRDARFLNKLQDLVSRMKDRDRRLFLQVAHKMAA